MTLTIDIKDSVADKILYFLNHFKDDVKVIKQEDTFLSDIKQSQQDLEDGNVIEIENVETYIQELADDIK